MHKHNQPRLVFLNERMNESSGNDDSELKSYFSTVFLCRSTLLDGLPDSGTLGLLRVDPTPQDANGEIIFFEMLLDPNPLND